MSGHLRQASETGLWLSAAWILNRLIQLTVWERFGQPVPSILVHIVSILIYGLAVTGIFGIVFGQSVTGIWATSGVFGLVFGFAGRSLIADLFCGVALHLDPPFRIGDWIEWREGDKDLIARVEQINWRSTRVHLRDDTKTIFIPNSHLAAVTVTNVFATLGKTRQIVRIPLDPGVDVDRAMRILLAAAMVAEGPLPDPPPQVLIEGLTTEGLIFWVRYWHDLENSNEVVRSGVMLAIMRGLHDAGIGTARSLHEMYYAPIEQNRGAAPNTGSILKLVDIFEGFSGEEMQMLVDQAVRLEIKAGTKIVEQGQSGDSMFLVAEGLLDIFINQKDKMPLRVSRLGRGTYFGEMSLLTGDPRSATVLAATSAVVYEVSKKLLAPILAARPGVADQLAATVARRQMQNRASLESAMSRESADAQSSFAKQVLSKILNFFGN